MKTKSILLWLALLVGSLITVQKARAEMGVSFDNLNVASADLLQTSGVLTGWSFTANQDLYLNRLGLWDFEKDTATETNHFVGLWDTNGNLLTSVAFVEPAQKANPSNPFHFYNVAPYKLTAGTTYVVAANMASDFYVQHDPTDINPDTQKPYTVPLSGLSFSSLISYGNAQNAAADPQNSYPTPVRFTPLTNGTGTADPTTAYSFGANIDVAPTPIPAAGWLLGSALIGLGGSSRRKKR